MICNRCGAGIRPESLKVVRGEQYHAICPPQDATAEELAETGREMGKIRATWPTEPTCVAPLDAEAPPVNAGYLPYCSACGQHHDQRAVHACRRNLERDLQQEQKRFDELATTARALVTRLDGAMFAFRSTEREVWGLADQVRRLLPAE